MRARSTRLLAVAAGCAAAGTALLASPLHAATPPARAAAAAHGATSPAAAAATAARAPLRSTAVGIDAREFRLAVYRPRVPTGEVRFNLENLGEDTHDLVVRNAAGRVLARSAEAKPGARIVLTTTLRSGGRYRLSCDVADHAQRGMRSTLTAVRPRG